MFNLYIKKIEALVTLYCNLLSFNFAKSFFFLIIKISLMSLKYVSKIFVINGILIVSTNCFLP